MKHIVLHPFVAILTFIIGVSIAGAILIRPNSQTSETSSIESNAKSLDDSSAWQVLISFENRDLANLEEKSKIELQKAIDSLVGPKKNPFLTPKLISRMENATGELRYAVIEESPLITIPGECGLRVSLFSLGGKHLGSSEFASGWRITLTGMKLTRLRNLGGDVLEVKSRAFINGRDVAKQYYAPVGEKMLLIRLEDSDGKLIRNISTSEG